jgi:O-antigen biosynthesis protein
MTGSAAPVVTYFEAGRAMAEDYYSHPRPEVRALFPPSARFVVDVGCGAGTLGAAIKREHPGTQVRGIEIVPEAAARAAQVLDDVVVGSGDGAMPESWPPPDCVILADVLEHMADPWAALRRWRARIRDGGYLLVSLPNAAHSSVIAGLWRGRWDYVDEGVLDRTHLRFFTRATALELVTGLGFEVEVVRRAIKLPGENLPWKVVASSLAVVCEREERGRRVPTWLVRVLDLCSYQILLRARAVGPRGPHTP